jgi:hypothetical protein
MSKSKKPDRFNAIVKKAQYGAALPFIFIDEAAQLLRAEHRAVVRLVKQQTILAGNVIDRGVLIAALARRMQ